MPLWTQWDDSRDGKPDVGRKVVRDGITYFIAEVKERQSPFDQSGAFHARKWNERVAPAIGEPPMPVPAVRTLKFVRLVGPQMRLVP